MRSSNFIKIFRRILIVFLLSIAFMGNCSAKKTMGYIITTDLEIIYGEIKIYISNPISGGYKINGIHLDTYHSSVAFKGEKDKHFNIYEPENIQGFGFTFKTVEYRFRSFKVEPKNIFKKEKTKHRFFLLIYEGELDLYQDVSMIITQDNNSREYTNVYYLNNNAVGINKVELTKEFRTLKDLLAVYSVDNDFLNTISPETKFNEIQIILWKYDIWLRNTKTENQIF